jgi:hypothetical protein
MYQGSNVAQVLLVEFLALEGERFAGAQESEVFYVLGEV